MYESFPGIRDIFSPKFSACHRQAEFCPKLCLSLPFSYLRPSFRAPTGAKSAETLPVGPDGVSPDGVSPDSAGQYGAGQYGAGLMEMIRMMSVRG